MPKNKRRRFPIPDWIQFYLEQNAGRVPIWQFPPISKMEGGIQFVPLTFRNRHDFLDLFEKDDDPWVDKRFKNAESMYEYVCIIRMISPYSFKRGGHDWLVYREGDCIGIVHAFDFSKESGEYTQRQCSIGYAFGASVRGSGIPQKVVRHLQDYLFTKWNRLYLTACVERENARSIRFLRGLGYVERPPKEPDPSEPDEGTSDIVCLDLFRSKRTQNKIHADWVASAKRYAAWRATWVKQADGSYQIPPFYDE
ncbi:MAG: GNAT family protein [Bacteroidota bacterium]